MPDFVAHEGVYLAEGHGHGEDELRKSLTAALSSDRRPGQAAAHAEIARISETWYSDKGGFGHDCAAHQDVNKRSWGAYCGSFRPVTIAADVPAPSRVERVRRKEG